MEYMASWHPSPVALAAAWAMLLATFVRMTISSMRPENKDQNQRGPFLRHSPLQQQKEWILSSTTIKLNTVAKQYRLYQLDKIKHEYNPLLMTWKGLNFGSECKPWHIGWPSDLTSRSCLVPVLQEVCSISGKEIYISSLFFLWFLDFIKYS